MPHIRWIPLFLLAGASALEAQALTLRDALARADADAFQNRATRAGTAAQRGQATGALRGILPALRLEGGFVRTDDPIGAFGTSLRQRAITPADFDPARLNRPAPISNYVAGLVLEQPLFNADAWMGHRAASRAVAASGASAEWTRLGTGVDVIRAYYGVTLAHERVATLAAAARAAHGHVRQAEAMVRQGLVTKSDALLASVRAGEVDAQLAEAEAEAKTSLRQLAVVLGQRGNFTPALPEQLPPADRIRDLVAADTADTPALSRSDVASAFLAHEAARFDLQRARSLYLPRLNGFARYDWRSARQLYGGDRSWTVGVMASWSPFAGASEIAEQQSTGGRADAARAMADAARERAELEVQQSGNSLRAALARLAISERSVLQSAEAHRIVARKYEGGLATVTDLLDAAAVDTRTALGHAAARYAVIVAGAERRKALGRDPGFLAALDDSTMPIVSTIR
jgi:outer membrane protein TolC